ncbi:MAG: hypothetical protein GY810_09390 [Aureispira sp.]|nr:hypothetical protein [Aureispira sp.]
MKHLLVLAALTLFLASCGGGPKGDPATVAAWEEIAEKGCACADKDCLFDIKVKDKSIMKWTMNTKTEDMTEEEKTSYRTARDKYMTCEKALTKQ